jgi:hypothetical protein
LTATEEKTATANASTAEANNELVFDRRLDLATAGLHPYIRKHLVTKISHENAVTIVDYVLAMNSEISLSDNYRRDNILTLKKLAELIKNNKSFKDM